MQPWSDNESSTSGDDSEQEDFVPNVPPTQSPTPLQNISSSEDSDISTNAEDEDDKTSVFQLWSALTDSSEDEDVDVDNCSKAHEDTPDVNSNALTKPIYSSSGRFGSGFDPRRSAGQPKAIEKADIRVIKRASGELARAAKEENLVLRSNTGSTPSTPSFRALNHSDFASLREKSLPSGNRVLSVAAVNAAYSAAATEHTLYIHKTRRVNHMPLFR